MSSRVSNIFSSYCHHQIDSENKERIVTEKCGHSKCRTCFIKEESGCVSCLSSETIYKSIPERPELNNEPEKSGMLQNSRLVRKNNNLNEVVGKGTNSNAKDIRILEEVIIKPFVDIPINKNDDLNLPRIADVRKFKYPSHLSWQTVNGETEFKCKICNKTFHSKSNRKYHFYCDKSVEKPFSCSKCTEKFATKNHLQYHENRHSNIQHRCKECDRTFLSVVSLRKHLKIHSNNLKHNCDTCDKKFYNKSELILHKYSHSKSPLPFQCETCQKSFAAKFQLNQHLTTHASMKSHACQFCDKAFTRNSTLTMHLLTHSNLPTKYNCELCSKSFERQRSYDRHLKIKHGSTLFICPICGVQSGRKDNVLRHIRNLHSDENFDDIVKQISKNVSRDKFTKPPKINERETRLHSPDHQSTDEISFTPPKSKITCQYQSVIQFAGRSQLLEPPTNIATDPIKDISSTACKNDVVENPTNNLKKFNSELRIELIEPTEPDRKIGNISIYRQLLSPYLKPPPNLEYLNGSSEQNTHRGFFKSQIERFPRKDNVDIYRSILMNTDEEHPSVIHNNSKNLSDTPKVSNTKTDSFVIHGQSNEYFSEMHWRKRTSQCFNQMEQ